MSNIKKKFNNVIFKIFISFLILSFVFFGISSFLLGSSENWVAKVGSKIISYSNLQNAMQSDRNLILRSSKDRQKAMKYTESKQFSIDILRKLINQAMIEKISEKYNIEASRHLILKSVAKDPTFHKNGKFDRDYFRYFLSENGFNEVQYVKMIQQEITNAIITSSIAISSPINEEIVKKLADLQEEQRVADIILIDAAHIGKIKAPTQENLKEIYKNNKEDFLNAQTRNISYITFKQSDIISDITVSSEEINNYYRQNKNNYKLLQSRNFYHVIFKDQKEASNFEQKIASAKNKKLSFAKQAKKIGKENYQLNNIDKKSLLPQIADLAFNLKQGELSEPIKSDLGYHIFLTTKIEDSSFKTLSTVKNDIKKIILSQKSEQKLSDKLAEIENFLVASNSITKAAQKFNLGKVRNIELTQKSKPKISNLTLNSYATNEGQVAGIYVDNNQFYALKVNKINEESYKKFADVKNILKKLYYKNQKQEKIKELAKNISKKVSKNPENIRKIARQNKLTLLVNKKINKSKKVNFQGRQIEISSDFQKELFEINEKNSTNYHQDGKNEYKIAVLKKIIKNKARNRQIQKLKRNLVQTYRQEFIVEFNNYIQKDAKIEVNQNFIKSMQSTN